MSNNEMFVQLNKKINKTLFNDYYYKYNVTAILMIFKFGAINYTGSEKYVTKIKEIIFVLIQSPLFFPTYNLEDYVGTQLS